MDGNRGEEVTEEVTEVVKIDKGYRINNKIIISDLDIDGENLTYNLYWDEEMIQEMDANQLANKFLSKAMDSGDFS